MEKIILYSLKTVRPKGKSKLPKLWKEALKRKPNKNISNLRCKCDISIDEYTALTKWKKSNG